jgi:hypothetical protein
MPNKDPRIDAYIAGAADFARPILNHIRKLVHDACPAVEETMKWNFPHFMHKGMLCSMAAFKAHCTFGFWKGELVLEKRGPAGETAHGQFGRMTSVSDLPPAASLIALIKRAVEITEQEIKSPKSPKPRQKQRLAVPGFVMTALEKNTKALSSFENLSPSHKKEYVEWLAGAKREETRDRRLKTALAWLSGGKTRNWKYDNC